MLLNFNSNLKVFPPIREKEDKKALIKGIKNGTIDVISSNHFPIELERKKCSFSKEQEIELKKFTENLGMFYLSTPFSRAAADRLEEMNLCAYKIGSGECNNYPLVKHILVKSSEGNLMGNHCKRLYKTYIPDKLEKSIMKPW